MLNDLNRLDLTRKDIEMIEAALHTQKKILSVQSQAGGAGARQKLTHVKDLTKRISRARPVNEDTASLSWSRTLRGIFFMNGNCTSSR